MSADSKYIRQVLDDRLSDLDGSVDAKPEDVQILAELRRGIGRLMADDVYAEEAILRVLQERMDRGELRSETYELVRSMMDRYIGEDVPTHPGDIRYETNRPPRLKDSGTYRSADDQFSSTTVLDKEKVEPNSADDHVQVGSVLRDRFMLHKRVSGGSMGVVFKALDRRLAEAGTEQPYVAIKVLSPQLARSGSALRALQQEAAKGRCLIHPNIVRFIDLDRDDELYFIVMEWLEGRTLAEILDSPDGKAIDLEKSLNIVRQIGKALEYAHRCGIVHADVKPGNIMVGTDGDVKLFDFGVARVLQSQNQNKSFDPAVLGAMTPAYSSLQVLTGEEPTPADDVFSLGCLMYRLVAGYRVYGPRNAAEAAEEGMAPQRIAALSDTQWAALKKAIAYARVARYDNVADFLGALDRTSPKRSNDEPISVDATDGYVDRKPRRSRNGMLLGLVSVLALVVAEYQYGWTDSAREWLEANNLWPASILQPAAPVDAGPAEPATVDTITTDGDVEGEVTADGIDDFSTNEATRTPLSIDPSNSFESFDVDESVDVIDFSTLPQADVDVPLIATQNDSVPIVVTLREDGAPVSVDLLRTDSLNLPLRLRVEEVAYSGNRSPWSAGQYTMSEDAIVEIPAGQDRARITLAMASDPLREADQQSTLRIRPAETTRTQLAAIEVILEDDDQRAFEAELPPNTVAFAVSQVSVRERDPAVQVDVLRFNPDDQPVVVGYVVRDITATEGDDFFAPSGHSLSFGPQQRSARLLIPLVQDSLLEGDEAFTVELAAQEETAVKGVFQRMVIMIRDDEIATE